MYTEDSTTRLIKVVVATVAMLALGILVAPNLSSWQSRRLADQITQRITEAKDTKVKMPLRQLADLGETAIEPLVVAATSNRAAVAVIARQILDEKLAAWQWSGEASSTVMLATALAAHIEEFGPAGKQWAERIALAMIEHADRLLAEQTPQLLEHCSQILAAVPPRGPRLRTLATRTERMQSIMPAQLAAPEPQLEPLTHRSESSLEIMTQVPPRVPTANRNQLLHVPQQRRTTSSASGEPLRWSGRWDGDFQKFSPLPANTLTAAPTPQPPPQPARPLNTDVIDIPNPQEMAKRAVALRELSSEALLRRLHKASFHEAGIIRTILVERGYDDTALALRQQLTSSKVEDRIRLVEEVSQLSASTASRVLRWLLEDKSGDVRLRALTALATTKSPDLNQLARALAASDEDPRVVKLASKLLRQSR